MFQPWSGLGIGKFLILFPLVPQGACGWLGSIWDGICLININIFFVEYVVPRMILTLPLTCEMDFPQWPTVLFCSFHFALESLCLWLQAKSLINFSGDPDCFKGIKKILLFSQRILVYLLMTFSLYAFLLRTMLTPCLAVFIKEREWILDFSA